MKTSKLRRFYAVAAALLAFATVAHSAPIAYVGTGQKQFGVIDLATGAFTARGSTPDVLEGLAFSNGVLYGIDTSGRLLTVDAADGATAIIGATGIAGLGPVPEAGPVSYFTSLSSGGLYAFDFANNLYSINAATGTATLIGATGIPQITTPTSSIAAGGDASSLYYLVESVDASFATLIPGSLYRVDPATGASTLIIETLPALPFSAGVVAGNSFYAFRASLGILPPPDVWRVDLISGGVVSVFPQDPSLGDVSAAIAAPVPEPRSATLIVTGTVALVVLSLSRHKRSKRDLAFG